MASAMNIIAGTLGWDISEVKECRYHEGHTTKPVFACGEHYYCIGKRNPVGLLDRTWERTPDQFWAAQGKTVLWQSHFAESN